MKVHAHDEESDRLVLLDQVADEFVRRWRAGEKPTIEEFTTLYPHLRHELRPILATLMVVERLEATCSRLVPEPTAMRIPETLGDYRLIREIGRGGMGVVYEAEQVSLKRRVALKLLPPGVLRDFQAIERFRREARAAARLHHTNIVPVFEVGQEGDICFYTMQFIDGVGLDQLIRRRNPALDSVTVNIGMPGRQGVSSESAPTLVQESGLSPSLRLSLGTKEYYREIARIGQQAACGLAHAHARGILHRDIKPSNLLLDAGGTVWITDFGLAKANDEDLTTPGLLVGTLRYMAPERLRGEGDARSDVYALGLTLYELVTCRPAFTETDHARLLEQISCGEPPRPRSFSRSIPLDLETIILRAIAKEPSRRYPDAHELAADLGRFLTGEPIRARRVGILERAWKFLSRYPVAASSFLLFILALVAVAVLSFVASQQSRKHAIDLEAALDDARKAERRARNAETDTLKAKWDSDHVAAELKLRQALAHARSGGVPRALFEMIDVLRLAPPDDQRKDFRRAVRCNIAAWSAQAPVHRYSVALPRGTPAQFIGPTAGTSSCFVTWGQGLPVQRWAFSTGKSVGKPIWLDKDEIVTSVSPDGNYLATTIKFGRLRRLDTGEVIADRLKHVTSHQWHWSTTHLLWTNHPRVFCSLSDHSVDEYWYRFWNLATKDLYPLALRLNRGDSFRVVPGEKQELQLLVFRGAASTEQRQAELWDLQSGKRVPVFRSLESLNAPLVVSDGRSILSLGLEVLSYRIHPGTDVGLRWWSARTGKTRTTSWQPFSQTLYSFTGHDGRTLVSVCRDERARLFDVISGLPRGEVVVPGLQRPFLGQVLMGKPSVALRADGGFLVTISDQGRIDGWDIASMQPVGGQQSSPYSFGRDGARSTSHDLIALSARGEVAFVANRGEGRVFEVGSPKRAWSIKHPNMSLAALTDDGRILATATQPSHPPVVCLWNTRTGKQIAEIVSPRFIHGLAFSPDGKWLGLACVGRVLLIDTASGKVRHHLLERTCAKRLLFSPDGKQLAVWNQRGWPGIGGGVRIWDSTSGKPISPFFLSQDYPVSLAYHRRSRAFLVIEPESKKVSCFTEGRWHFLGELPVSAVTQPTSRAVDSRIAVICSHRRLGQIELPNIGNAQQSSRLRPVATPWEPSDVPNVIAYSPDGRWLAGGCVDRTLWLWDSATGIPVGPITSYAANIRTLAFSADSKALTVVTEDGKAHRKPIPSPVVGSIRALEDQLEHQLRLRKHGDNILFANGVTK